MAGVLQNTTAVRYIQGWRPTTYLGVQPRSDSLSAWMCHTAAEPLKAFGDKGDM